MDCQVTVNRHEMYISLYISLLLGELTPSLAHRHALYGSRRVTDSHWLAPCTEYTVRGVAGAVTESEAGVCLALLVQGK